MCHRSCCGTTVSLAMHARKASENRIAEARTGTEGQTVADCTAPRIQREEHAGKG